MALEPKTVRYNKRANECMLVFEDKTGKLLGKMGKVTDEMSFCSLGFIGKIFLELGGRCMSFT